MLGEFLILCFSGLALLLLTVWFILIAVIGPTDPNPDWLSSKSPWLIHPEDREY